jgi:hypothetical protein
LDWRERIGGFQGAEICLEWGVNIPGAVWRSGWLDILECEKLTE